MKRFIYLFTVSVLLFSCGYSSESKLKDALKDVVIEKAGFNPDYEFISMETDTVTVKDLNEYLEKQFPKDEYPDGVPSDFKSEQFETFIAPLKSKKNDNEMCFLSIKHKYSIDNPILGKRVEVIRYDLFEEMDGKYKYVGEDLRKEKFFSDVDDYKFNKQMEQSEAEIKKTEQQYDSIINAM